MSELGIGRGSGFEPLKLGDPNWLNYSVIGDMIRWSDVFPEVDLTVRYVHDILKVDVIVGEALTEDIRAQLLDGKLSGTDYLTARFEIPGVAVFAEARQAGESRNLYDEPLTINKPLKFMRDDKVIHEIRPVEAFVLDEFGEPLRRGVDEPMGTAQLWQLSEKGSGIAEMSVSLAAIAKAPKGDLLIDPSTSFGPYFCTSCVDALLDYNNQDTKYGSATTMVWNSTTGSPDRSIFGFNVSSLGTGKNINSAILRIHVDDADCSDDMESRAYRITEQWYEDEVTWNDRHDSGTWDDAGGTFDSPEYQSPPVEIPEYSYTIWAEYDVTDAFKAHYSSQISDVQNKGFLVKLEDTLNWGDTITIFTSECAYSSLKPQLVVTYDQTEFGADAGHAWGTVGEISSRQADMKTDNMYVMRLFAQEGNLSNFAQAAYNNGMRVILEFPCGPMRGSGILDLDYYTTRWWKGSYAGGTPTDYANWLEYLIDPVSDYIDGTISNTIIGVEIGNEEDACFAAKQISSATELWVKWPSNKAASEEIDYCGGHLDANGEPDGDYVFYATAPIYYDGGMDFADYYMTARKRLNDKWPNLMFLSGGSGIFDRTIAFGDDPADGLPGVGQLAGALLCGFIDGVTAHLYGSVSTLPDTITIHGYTLALPPEADHADGVGSQNEWIHRLDDLKSKCSRASGYEPDYAVTEYACSPMFVSDTTQAQAIYYIRRCLMDATMLEDDAEKPLHYSLYFHHPESDYPWGMHAPSGDSRPIRKVARYMFAESTAPNPSPELGREGTSVWLQATSDRETYEEDNENVMNCGWETESGQKWGAIWRYENDDTTYFEESGDERYFVVEGEDTRSLDACLYKFTGLSDYSTAAFGPVPEADPVQGTYSGGNTTYEIPDVDENPTFLKFVSD